MPEAGLRTPKEERGLHPSSSSVDVKYAFSSPSSW
ncbi:hypothetical protein HRED_06542, partial [Candidatus Haloredivivus sp. G17]